MEKLTLASVDFGSKKISASVGRVNEGDIEIIDSFCYKSEGIEKGLIIDEAKCCQSLENAINGLEEITGIKVTKVYAGISSRNIRMSEVSCSVNLRDGIVRGIDIKRALDKGKRNVVHDEDEEIVDVIIDFFNIDGKVFYQNVTGWKASTLEVNITVLIGKSSEMDKYRKVIRDCGLEVEGFLVNIISGRKIFLNEKNSLGHKVLVDIGAGTSEVAIFNNGILKYISSIPLGGDNITKDLSICGDLPLGEAENLKKIYSFSYESLKNQEEVVKVGSVDISTKLFYEVIKARIEEILHYVNLELKKTSFFEGICSIIIYGNGMSHYEDIVSIVKEELDKKTKIVKSEELGIEESGAITSLAIVKEVYDRLELLYDKSVELEIEKEELEFEKDDLGIIGKLKSFLGEIF